MAIRIIIFPLAFYKAEAATAEFQFTPIHAQTTTNNYQNLGFRPHSNSLQFTHRQHKTNYHNTNYQNFGFRWLDPFSQQYHKTQWILIQNSVLKIGKIVR